MKKDPAFLFYSKDFYEGTRTLLPEERAAYIDLLIYQHQNGAIPEDFRRLTLYCAGISEEVIKEILETKFVKTENGYINERLFKTMEDRAAFSSRQSINGAVGQFYKKAKSLLPAKDYKSLRDILKDLTNEDLFETIKDKNINIAMLKAMLKQSANINENENIILIKEIIFYLNNKFDPPKTFKPTTRSTREHINARISEGYVLSDFKKVVDVKFDEWFNTKMEKYLVPETLFSPANFEKYLNQRSESEIKTASKLTSSTIREEFNKVFRKDPSERIEELVNQYVDLYPAHNNGENMSLGKYINFLRYLNNKSGGANITIISILAKTIEKNQLTLIDL